MDENIFKTGLRVFLGAEVEAGFTLPTEKPTEKFQKESASVSLKQVHGVAGYRVMKNFQIENLKSFQQRQKPKLTIHILLESFLTALTKQVLIKKHFRMWLMMHLRNSGKAIH